MNATSSFFLFSPFAILKKKKTRSNGPLWRKEEVCSFPIEKKRQTFEGAIEKRVKGRRWVPPAHAENGQSDLRDRKNQKELEGIVQSSLQY